MIEKRALAICVLLGACGGSDRSEPGRMVIELGWDAGQPAIPLWMHASIEERSVDAETPGPVIASQAAMLDEAARAKITLNGVPNGDDRVVVVTMRDGPDPNASFVHYRGSSERFSLSPGIEGVIAVRVPLRPVPDEGALEVYSYGDRWLNLSFDCGDCDGHRIYVAQDEALTRGVVVYTATMHGRETRSSRSPDARYSMPYDLATGCESGDCRIEGLYALVRDRSGKNVRFVSARALNRTVSAPIGSWLVPVDGAVRDVLIDRAKTTVYVLVGDPPRLDVYSLVERRFAPPTLAGSDPISFDFDVDETSLLIANAAENKIYSVALPELTVSSREVTPPDGPFSGPILAMAVDRRNDVWLARDATTGGCNPLELSRVRHDYPEEGERRVIGELPVSGGARTLAASGDRWSLTLGLGAGANDCRTPSAYLVDVEALGSPFQGNFRTTHEQTGPVGSIVQDGDGGIILAKGSLVFEHDEQERALLLRGLIDGGEGPAVIAPSGLIGFRLRQQQLEVLDLAARTVARTMPLPDTVIGGGANAVGEMAVSVDGKLVVVISDRGVSIVSVP